MRKFAILLIFIFFIGCTPKIIFKPENLKLSQFDLYRAIDECDEVNSYDVWFADGPIPVVTTVNPLGGVIQYYAQQEFIACMNAKGWTAHSVKEIGRLIQKSRGYFAKENWKEVISITSEVLDLDPTNELAYAIRAGAYANSNLCENAIEDCNIALNINPDFGLAYNNRGWAFQVLGKNKEAALDYEKGCNLGLELACNNLKVLTATNGKLITK